MTPRARTRLTKLSLRKRCDEADEADEAEPKEEM